MSDGYGGFHIRILGARYRRSSVGQAGDAAGRPASVHQPAFGATTPARPLRVLGRRSVLARRAEIADYSAIVEEHNVSVGGQPGVPCTDRCNGRRLSESAKGKKGARSACLRLAR